MNDAVQGARISQQNKGDAERISRRSCVKVTTNYGWNVCCECIKSIELTLGWF